MKTDNIYKIDCTTITTWRNTKTGEAFKEKKEGPDIVQDVNCTSVSPKGLDMMQKAMSNKNDNKPNPKGGTELQQDYLHKYVDKNYYLKYRYVHLCQVKFLASYKSKYFVAKNSYDQSNLHYHWFKDKSNHDKYDWYVFNSHWNYEHLEITLIYLHINL